MYLGLLVLFCSQGVNNFHDACGHYGEILPRQQPITARDFAGSNLRHIIISRNDHVARLITGLLYGFINNISTYQNSVIESSFSILLFLLLLLS